MRNGFVLHHNGPPARCVGADHDRCGRFWNGVKNYHALTFGEKWRPYSLYSFGVCPHGVLFIGRGWTLSQAANGRDVVGANDGADAHWYTVLAFLGGDEQPTPAMLAGLEALIVQGRTNRWCGDRVLPHNRFKRKACPGPELTAQAHAWDRTPLGQTPPAPKENHMGATIIALYAHWRKDPDAAVKDWPGFRFWLKRGEAVGESAMADELAGALAHEAGF